jgi:hypothetical protein
MPPLAGVVSVYTGQIAAWALADPADPSRKARPTTIPLLLKQARSQPLAILPCAPSKAGADFFLPDELKYRTKYRQLKAKIGEIEDVRRRSIHSPRVVWVLNGVGAVLVDTTGEFQARSKDTQSEAERPAVETGAQVREGPACREIGPSFADAEPRI